MPYHGIICYALCLFLAFWCWKIHRMWNILHPHHDHNGTFGSTASRLTCRLAIHLNQGVGPGIFPNQGFGLLVSIQIKELARGIHPKKGRKNALGMHKNQWVVLGYASKSRSLELGMHQNKEIGPEYASKSRSWSWLCIQIKLGHMNIT